jgi:hypothetical protein
MTDKHIAEKHHLTFDGLRHFDEQGNEFWLARQLAKVLEYSEYRHFLPVVERARQACLNSGRTPEDHFEDILEMVEIGSGARREVEDVRFSRYIGEWGQKSVRPELVEGPSELVGHRLRQFDKLTAHPERFNQAHPERIIHA